MKALNKILGLLPVAAALMLTACSEDITTENIQAPAEEPTTEATGIPFTVTVSTGEAATRAGLANYTDPSDATTYLRTLKFEEGDLLYITSTKGHGVLTLSEGANTNTATFTGTLSETPDADTELTATLVSHTQYVSTTQDTPDLVTINSSTHAVTVNYPEGYKYLTTYNDAIKMYSKLTGTALYGSGAPSFSLAQKSVFFHIDVDLNDAEYGSSSSTVNLTLKNGTTTIVASGIGSQKIGSSDYKYIRNYYYITDVDHLASLSNATLTIEGKGITAVKSIKDVATIQGKFYNINRTMLSVGDVIADDGKAYESAAKATAAGATARAMIAHVGKVDKYCDSFLAIATQDFGRYMSFNTANGDASTDNTLAKWASTHGITIGSTTYNGNALAGVAGNTYDEVTSSTTTSNQTAGTLYKGWRIPSVTDWRYILAGLTSNMPTPLSPAYSATSPAGITNDGSIYSSSVLFDVINTAWGLSLSNTNAFLTSSHAGDNIFYLISKATNENYFHLITKEFGDGSSSPKIYGRAVFAY